MKPWTRKLFALLALFTILSLVISACGPIVSGNDDPNNDIGKGKDKEKDKGNDKGNEKEMEGKITICHKTGSTKNPYVEITVSDAATMDGHSTHEDDLIPAPEGGCLTE